MLDDRLLDPLGQPAGHQERLAEPLQQPVYGLRGEELPVREEEGDVDAAEPRLGDQPLDYFVEEAELLAGYLCPPLK